jgi:type IV pilus assembly protein PilC
MPRFSYLARDTSGGSRDGEITAKTRAEAARLLRADGKYVVKLRELAEHVDREAGQIVVIGRRRVRPEEIIFFFNQLAIMVETGVTLTEAIHGVAAQVPPGRFQTVLKQILRDVEAGEPFSTALAGHPRAFSDFFVNLVRAAEASGTLGPTLARCAEYLAYQREIRKKVKSAVRYPLVLLVAATGVTAFLMTYVLPKFLSIYAGREAILPLPTRILMTITDSVVSYWLPILGVLLVGVAVVVWFFRARVPRRQAHWVQLHTPLIGRMLHQSYIASSLRTLGILVDSGVSMLDAVAIARSIADNHYFQKMWTEVDAALHRGEQLSVPLYRSSLMPRPIVQMVEAGEKSGRLGPVLVRLCDFLDAELRATIKNATQMIEPVMITIAGAVVGGIVIALLLPILSISRVIAH